MSRERAGSLGIRPLARVVAYDQAGVEPLKIFAAPISVVHNDPLANDQVVNMRMHDLLGKPPQTQKVVEPEVAKVIAETVERLDEIGIDVAVLYPTYGLTVTAVPVSAKSFRRKLRTRDARATSANE